MAFEDYIQNPLVQFGARLMAASDPRRQGLGGLGEAVTGTGAMLRERAQLAEENERARMLADLQVQELQSAMAQRQAEQAEAQRQIAAQQEFAAQPGLSPMQSAAIQAGYGPQVVERLFEPEAQPKLYTKAAQITADTQRGFLSPEMGDKLLQQEMQGEELKPADRFKMEGDLNKRFDKNAQAFREISNAYTTIQSIPETAIGDVALATKIMKILDPDSVVRESELGVALGATGVLDRLLNLANRAKEGEFLTADQRREFKALAENVYTAAQQEFSNLRTSYTQRALGYGLNPENVVYDYSSQVTSGGQKVTPPKGYVLDK